MRYDIEELSDHINNKKYVGSVIVVLKNWKIQLQMKFEPMFHKLYNNKLYAKYRANKLLVKNYK
jgi:hypothetical protein